MQATLKQFQQDMAAKQANCARTRRRRTRLAGEAFLATNKNNPGVVTLPDGLQYKILTDGTGAMPTAGCNRDGELSRHVFERHGVRQFRQVGPSR